MTGRARVGGGPVTPGRGVTAATGGVASENAAPPLTVWRARALVTSYHRRRGLRIAQVRDDAKRLLHALGVNAELSVALVSDEEMRQLNATYRGVDRPTDVLAFAFRVGDGADLQTHLLGDVVVSLDTAARQAVAHRVSFADEVRMLLIHGVLHLLGWDHERSQVRARRMFRKQRQMIAQLRRGEAFSGRNERC